MVRMFAAALAVLALPASAQAVYKCKDAKLGTVYQSIPCPDGPEEKRWNASTNPSRDNYARRVAEQRVDQDRQYMRARNAQDSTLGATLISSVRAPGPEACERARHVRDSARQDPSMNRDYDFMQAVEKSVSEACR
ncbi:DUF4124 domain-containing protein [Pseudoxanthomonas sp. SL93]|jgi:hypothetical protein|uniref:DUF4124 domain-containing protein n=1 Tax=Pseudoxanthomonas sp. SL93 TaxID=2995142 RepID=UPI00227161D9|nr:DUF4124 domain-containing protein [Pseudoxanthomonas sp. SL93]WAC64729.1 DUF4124 domain-containing protein [Pseudoxanthomonas sp. SL93]